MHSFPEGVTLEASPCPNGCALQDSNVLVGHDRIHGIPGCFSVVRCVHCGLMRTDPRPTARTIGAYYPNDYGPYHTSDAPPSVPTTGFKAQLRHLLGMNARVMPKVVPGHMLEIGCANGSYMDQMHRSGWTVEGIEFSDAAAQRARDKGFAVQTGSVESARDPEQQVDVVAAWMVLEHLHDPVGALHKMRRWVKPDGYLIAAVPDAGAKLLQLFGERRYDLHLPNHLYHFTPESLAKLFETSGWRIERVFWQRNCNSLLRSVEYLAHDHGWHRIQRLADWLRRSRSAASWRYALHVLAGWTRQSGRIEVWARPVSIRPDPE
jgi:SAM-dependent methyltransferase